MLEPLGIGDMAEALYRALLTQGPATEARLAEIVHTDEDVVRKGLADLADLELATRSADAPGRWAAGSPDVAMTSLVVRQQEELLQRQRELERVQATVSDLVRLSRARGPGQGTQLVEVTSDLEATRRRCGHLYRTMERSLDALDKLPYGVSSDEPYDPDDEDGELDMLQRGIEIHAIYEHAAFQVPGRFDVLRRLAAAGEQARTLPTLPMKLVIYDRAHAVVQLDESDGAATTAVFVHQSGLLTGLVGLFDLLWDRAVPLPPTPAMPLGERTDDVDEALLALLAAGFKDESIARHLGVSPSTVTRRMARLMELSGTSTRFQLGMQAVRRSWI